MAISYPLTFPTHIGPHSVTFRQVNANTLTQSPFTYKQQSVAHAGQRWEADIFLPPMGHADARAWIGWLVSLKGYNGTFLMGDPLAATPRGSAGGTPLVNGANQSGDELILDGATASQTGWLKAGDYIQLGSAGTTTLHMVMADADSDGSGNVTLDIWPDLRSSPANNATVVVSSTLGQWRLNSNSVLWDETASANYGMSFTVVEAIG